jgi:hypothetical protein
MGGNGEWGKQTETRLHALKLLWQQNLIKCFGRIVASDGLNQLTFQKLIPSPSSGGLSCKLFQIFSYLCSTVKLTSNVTDELVNLISDAFSVNTLFICKRDCTNQPGPTYSCITSRWQKFPV